MLSLFNDETHWRNRAEEARRLVEHLTNSEARRVMLGVAEGYDRLAQGGGGQNCRRYSKSRRTRKLTC
jgi:hypothetical protein